MSQRYPPPLRDRSPPRQFDRRSSNTYTPLAASSSYRPGNDNSAPPLDRPPPRGPRADSFRGGNFSFNSAPRGRGGGFGPRGGDSWDRDRDRDLDRDRDARNVPGGFRRDDDRPNWTRRDERPPAFNRDRTYVSRERSASPVRPRRDSKEIIAPAFSRAPDAGPSYFSGNVRGGSDRGRGRGVWDRNRGRSSFIGDRDRDLFPAGTRSRSREGWREREPDRGRNFGPDADRNERPERRDYDRPFERDLRSRDHDIWQRDHSPGRSSTGNRAASPGALSSISQDRIHKAEHDLSRKPLASSSILQSRDARRDADGDYFTSRNDGPRREPSFAQPPPVPAVPQSSSLGLDYGPPPSAPASTPAAPVAEKPNLSSKTSKPDPPSTASSFQPPSGPKANRGPNVNASHAPPLPSTQPLDRSKIELFPQHDRSQLPEPPMRQTSETPRPPGDAFNDRSMPLASQPDRPLPPNVPSGPRISSGTPYKHKTSPVVHQTPLPSVQPKTVSTDSRNQPNVPTGPRSASILPPSGPRALPIGPASAQGGSPLSPWARRAQIEYRPQKPSIMNTMNRPHMADRASPASMQMKPKLSPRPTMAQLSDVNRTSQSSRPTMIQETTSQVEVKKEGVATVDVEMSAPASEDEEGDSEPESELDENYFADSEKVHAREMELLKAKKPAPLLEDSAVVNLLVRIQLLGMIADGLVPDGIHAMQEDKDIEMRDRPTESLISPNNTPEPSQTLTLEHPKPRGRPLKEPLVNPIPTPPIEDLPFLEKPLEHMVLFEEPDEDEVQSEKITTILRNQFEKEAWDEKEDLEELCEFYRQKYPEWKYEIDKYERARRELEATPDPGSPGGQSAASIPQSVERLTGRAARNATEFDIEKAILMSQQSAREEEERREREAASNAKPNPDTEAIVPAMLKPSEREPPWRFQDSNTFVPTKLSVELMQYIPPEDDFTNEEQARFITAFCQAPKKWGLIAEQIPGRSYQECIAHYYLTKNQANYKEHWRRSQPKRKRGRAATKPRSTALLSDMALNEDPDSTPAPVTDSGRPRRAAAPTFGDVTDPEAAAMPAAKRLAVAPTEAVEGAIAPKPKGRKAGTATKVRRTKAQILADKQAMALQTNPDGSPVKVGAGRARTLAAAKTDVNAPPVALRPGELEPQQLANIPIPVTVAPMRQRSPQLPVVTSYWSVPEVQKFRQLVAYYGRDFGKIADFMKTKSQAMIKNHYQRECAKGDIELERLAQIAEEKVSRGEPLGRLPSPVAPPKRKYDATPSMTPRPLTANAEAALEADRAVLPAKATHVEDFPPNTLVRDASGSIVAKPSPREALLQNSPLHVPVQPKTEDLPRERPILAQKPMQGPQRGLFTHDEGLFHQRNQQRHQFGSHDHVLHHHPPHVVDLRGGDVPPTQPRDLVAQPRDVAMQGQTGLLSQYRGFEPEQAPAMRQIHSRNASLTGPPVSVADQQAADSFAIQNERRRLMGIASTQSPRLQAMQASVAPRPESYPAFAVHQHQHQQQLQPHLQQQPPPPAVKPDPPKPAPAKRSNVFGLLNNDDPPERSVKRSSTDSTHRNAIQTPPPQPVAPQPQHTFHHRAQEDLLGRPGVYGIKEQPSHRNIQDLRSAFSNSPAPSHRQDAWLDKFDPRQVTIDRTSNHSPSYSVVPPAPTPSSKPQLQHTISDGLRMLEPNGPRHADLGKSQISSPSRQIPSPVPQYRPASAAPQHNRMSSLSYSQNALPGPDRRSLQQQPQQQHHQPPVSHPPSASATPIPSMHRRGEPSVDYNQRRLTIQEWQKTHGNMDQPRDPRELVEHRHPREDILPRGHEQQHRSIAPPPPTTMQEQPRGDPRDMYRSEPGSHQVPPPPSRASQFDPRFGGVPQRTYSPFGNDPRLAHNQHAHQHHHSISAQQGPPQQHQQPPQGQGGQAGMHHHHHHHGPGQHQQPQLVMPPQHQGLAPHAHQPQAMHQGQPGPQYREQPRVGQPQQGLAPQYGHFRGYSQGVAEDDDGPHTLDDETGLKGAGSADEDDTPDGEIESQGFNLDPSLFDWEASGGFGQGVSDSL
ncbi:hypothetical protein OHC33_004024 [Knufia fluminis]|uniref:SANT domain-containing protein n=1 Tax=Knufia fluminis TaxID=191047 RepID=A0AAN8I962_9EURO|nr:hypothetical protein OHC33_004024 [Knufia fluminis]